MRAVTLALCLIVAVSAVAVNKALVDEFNAWMTKYGKTYSAQEYPRRLANYKASLERMKITAKKSPSAVFAPNRFSDLTVDEFRSLYLMNKTSTPAQTLAISCLANGVTAEAAGYRKPEALPTSWDWRSKNKVTPVKDQGQCGSCWAFSTSGCLESAYAIKNNQPATQQFSEQMIVDCSHGCCMEEGQQVCNSGCGGGWMWNAMTDIMSWGGLETEDAYPYTGEDGTCSMSGPYMAAMKNYTCLSVPNGADETTLMPTFVMNAGPLSIAMNADLLMDYSSGIVAPSSSADCDPTSLDHALLIVGWGVDASAGAYWIVKNSWNQSWGESGYFRIIKGSNACGLANAVVSPILA
jgi:C1A family cysteine protease